MPVWRIRIRLLLPRLEEVSGLGISFAAHLALTALLLAWGSARAELGPALPVRPMIAVDLKPAAARRAPVPTERRPTPEPAAEKRPEPPKPKPAPKRTEADAPKTVVEKPEGATAQPAELPESEPPPPEPSGEQPGEDDVAADLPLDGEEIPGGVAGAMFGDTGFRADWYVQAVQAKLQDAWRDRPTLPAGRESMRVVVAFRILRDGTVVEPRLAVPSGYAPLDHSALRAVQSLRRMPALPRGYENDSVPARFVFELVPAGGR